MNGTQEPEGLQPGLYIVATPIGNLGDITLRAVDVLSRCDAVACEDTRVAGKLLHHLGIRKPLWRYDDHASDEERARLLAASETQAVALVSDAGTPLISDPGYRLVREARARGLAVTSLPGPSAVITALSSSGLATDRFLFAGFLPAREGARKAVLEELAPLRATLVFFESGPRLLKSLKTIEQLMPDREIAVARELTKVFEEVIGGHAAELIDHYASRPPKGEIVLLVGRSGVPNSTDDDIDSLLRAELVHEKPSRAAANVARMTGGDRSILYTRAMEIKQGEQEGR